MQTIKIYGELAKLVGCRTFKVDVSTPAEAVRFLVVNFPHVEKFMSESHYRVRAGKTILSEDDLHFPVGKNEAISLTPVIAGRGAVGRIIAGVVLIAASFFIPGVALFNIALAPIAFSIGASLVLGGVAQLLTPVPQKKKEDPQENYSFSGIQNTSRQGIPIPVVYGETIVGSVTISAGYSVEEIDDD